jgi:hypothetical protein
MLAPEITVIARLTDAVYFRLPYLHEWLFARNLSEPVGLWLTD